MAVGVVFGKERTSRGKQVNRSATKRVLLSLSVALIAAVVVALVVADPDATAKKRGHHHKAARTASLPCAPPPSGSGSAAVGAWNPRGPWGLTNLDSYCRQVGRKPAVVLWYQSWGPYDQGRFPTSQARLLYLQGYAQLLT